MNQGTVFRRLDNPEYPYFVIAQSDQLIDLNTRVVIPFVMSDGASHYLE